MDTLVCKHRTIQRYANLIFAYQGLVAKKFKKSLSSITKSFYISSESFVCTVKALQSQKYVSLYSEMHFRQLLLVVYSVMVCNVLV